MRLQLVLSASRMDPRLARGSGAKAGHPRFDLPLIRAIRGIRGRLLHYQLVL